MERDKGEEDAISPLCTPLSITQEAGKAFLCLHPRDSFRAGSTMLPRQSSRPAFPKYFIQQVKDRVGYSLMTPGPASWLL